MSGARISPRSVWTASPVCPVDCRRLELELALVGQQPAQLAVVKRRKGPRQEVADGAVRGVDHELVEGLLPSPRELERLQPTGRDPARGGLPLADLIAVEHEYLSARSGQLTRHREAREARPADQDVALMVQRRALGAALGRTCGHRSPEEYGNGPGATDMVYPQAQSTCQLSQPLTNRTDGRQGR